MNNLTNLIIKYKETKSQSILNEIFNLLNSTIVSKSKYIYFVKWFPKNLYHPCKYCRNCSKLNNVPKNEHKTICEDCQVCRCEKGFFNLNKNNLCEYEDVYQDLNIKILQIINNFKPEEDFNKYPYSWLFDWRPSFITNDFIKSLSHEKIYKINEDESEEEIGIEDNQEKNIRENLKLEDILKYATTKRELDVINLFLNDNTMTQEKAGEIIGISHQAISLIFKKLQKKLKNHLQN
jgi:RNA polymerase sigma factor (sigma-70 family)